MITKASDIQERVRLSKSMAVQFELKQINERIQAHADAGWTEDLAIEIESRRDGDASLQYIVSRLKEAGYIVTSSSLHPSRVYLSLPEFATPQV